MGATGNGVLTEVYVDQENKSVDIAIINTYLAIADDDYNEKQEDVSVTVYGITDKVKRRVCEGHGRWSLQRNDG